MLLGLGAHYRVEVALQRALAELTQSLREDTEAPEGHWWHTVRQANPAYLYPDPTQPMRRPTDFIDQSTDDLLTDIEQAVALMRAEGMELIVHDLTRPETGLNVMRVIVPGLSHFWPRFGDPRI
ncbi:MAG: YcaO-like family protein, partial [bacterium]|nr:YcaO-like family protein [bacterium]